jgi:hypothetical protein
MLSLSQVRQHAYNAPKNGYHAAAQICTSIKTKLFGVVTVLKNDRDDLAISTKVVQIGLSALGLYNWHFNKQAFGKLSATLTNAADMTFFWAIVQQPRSWFFPVTADSINVPAAERILTQALTEMYGVGNTHNNLQHIDENIRFAAKVILKEQLDAMSAPRGPVYRNAQEFADALASRVRSKDHYIVRHTEATEPTPYLLDKAHGAEVGFTFKDFHLTDCRFPLVKPSLLQRITNFNWLVVDLGTTTMFLKFWNLVDTGKIAKSIGESKIFGKQLFGVVNLQPFEVWVRGSIVTGLVLNLIDVAKRCSKYNTLDASDRKKLKLDAIANAADLVYHGSTFVNEAGIKTIPAGYLDALSIVARTVGICCIHRQPKPKYIAQLNY